MTTTRQARRSTLARADVNAIWFGLAAFISIGSLAAALVSQHAFGMEPCPWCVLQRLVFAALALVAAIGLAGRGRTSVAVGAAGLGIALAASGAAASLWQHFVAARSASCNLTLADRIVAATGLDNLLPDVFMARASCADAAVDLLGLPYSTWSLTAFVLCGLVFLRVVLDRRP